MINGCSKKIKRFGKDFIKASPVILFFLIVFYSVIFIFGTQYVLLVSVATTAFKLNYQKNLSWRRIGILVAEQLIVCVLAFVASRNLLLCIVMNGLVPFLLVFLRTTRFNQRGYFVNAMTFVFLQLRPVELKGLLPQLGVFSCILVFLGGMMKLWALLHRNREDYMEVREGLQAAADRFRTLSLGKRTRGVSAEMSAVQNQFYSGSTMRVNAVQGSQKKASVSYIFSLLFQRTAYFILDYLQLPNAFGEADRQLFEKLADYLEQVKETMNNRDNEALIQKAGELLNELDEVQERVLLYSRNVLHLLVMALQLITAKEKQPSSNHIDWRRFWEEKKERLNPRQFEMRFAMRLAIVLMAGFCFSRCLNITHSYWLPLNAFLLVQPMYEESTRRMKNRFAGTILGSILIFIILQHQTSITGHFLLAAVMISFMYTFVPGSIPQAVFSTGFALTLTSISLDSAAAVELRFAYVLGAVILVLFANRFCFPTSLHGQFQFNIREAVHMEQDYLNLLKIGCRRSIDYVVMEDALAQFNLTYSQALEYLAKNQNSELEICREFLNILWRMAAEVEQMVFYVTTEAVTPEDRERMLRFTSQMQDMLRAVGKGEEMQMLLHPEEGMETKNKAVLGHLMEKYCGNMERLAVLCQENKNLRKYFEEDIQQDRRAKN